MASLDEISISTSSGLVLWSRSYNGSSSSSSSSGSNSAAAAISSLVQEVLLNDSSGAATSTSFASLDGASNGSSAVGNGSGGGECSRYDKDNQSLMWTLANDLGLIFVVVWPRILHLNYLERLLQTLKTLFVDTYGDTVRSIVNNGSAANRRILDWSGLWKGWTSVVDRLVRELEQEAARAQRKGGALASSRLSSVINSSSSSSSNGNGSNSDAAGKGGAAGQGEADEATTPTLSPARGTVADAEAIARNIAALKARNKARLSPSPRGVKVGKKGGVSSASEASDNEAVSKKTSTPGKAARKWDDSGRVDEKDMASLDFSSGDLLQDDSAVLDALVDADALGKRGQNGFYEVADYDDKRARTGSSNDDEDDEDDSILAALASSKLTTRDSKAQSSAQSSSKLSSFFSKLSLTAGLSSKTITSEDIQPVLNVMREHLMNKNVARDIADKICDSVGQSLIGKTTSGFGDGGVKAEFRRALEASLTRILTSKTSTDILLDITRKRQAVGSIRDGQTRDPYTITFVGVNGVGKSTNLSKVAFWLLQNRLRVLIAACDTFRSGAVEQLRVHVRNLGKLKVIGDDGYSAQQVEGKIELFEKGYGKDAAGIAKDAISHARENGFDVVLIDTAGRMQDNEPLMRALAKLVSVNRPDKILFVGEAVVGNEAVDQLTKFNRSLRDFSGVSDAKARGIDGMILTKMDIIDDKVGAALSMTYVTGQPIVFIGTGQTYTDLKAMKVGHVVNALMRA